jgi:hypothetical protein
MLKWYKKEQLFRRRAEYYKIRQYEHCTSVNQMMCIQSVGKGSVIKQNNINPQKTVSCDRQE